MFITSKYAGYNRHGEQSAAGYFLILMQPKNDSGTYPFHSGRCLDCSNTKENHREPVPVYSCATHGIMARLKARAAAKQEPIDSDFQEIVPLPDCPDCQRHDRELTALGCTHFRPAPIAYPLRGIVRYVRMRQLGAWMMGRARIHNTSITLSGSYGSDGLPCTVPDAVYEAGTLLPNALYEAWNTGGGWNGAGSEAPAMRAWALKTFPRPQR